MNRSLCPLFLVLFSVNLLGCKLRNLVGTNVKHGAEDGLLATNSVLLKAGPNDSILVCGKYAQEVEKSIKDWASQIGRSEIVKVQSQCPNARQNYAYVVETRDNETSKVVAEYCKEDTDMTAFAYPNDYGFAGRWFYVNNCNDLSDVKSFSWKINIAHEVGHLWGMCDQYNVDEAKKGIGVGMHATCSSNFRSRFAELSVMNAGGVLDENSSFISKSVILMPNDAVALRLMACRSDIPANETWLQKRTDLVAQWRSEDYFRNEIQRLRGNGISFLPQCLGSGTPGIEGTYNTPKGAAIDCCLCEEQNYEDTSTLGYDKNIGQSFYTLSNIESGPFNETICFGRIGKKIDSVTIKGSYRYVKSCQKVSKESEYCPTASNAWLNVDGKTVYKHLTPIGDNQYKLDEVPK
jgi:hypothetical protein